MISSIQQAAVRDAAFAKAIVAIMEDVADGVSLAAACAKHKLTRYQFRTHCVKHPESRAQFEVAREQQSEAIIDEILDVARSEKIDPRLQANRLKALMFLLEKRDPARYGQRAAIEHTIKGRVDLGAAIADSDKQLATLLAQRAALALPAKVAVASPVPAGVPGPDVAWAELVGDDDPAK